jgi:hypothetical protein
LIPASAAAEDPPPTVTFLDDRDLVIDFDHLRDQLDGEVVVYVRNNDPEETHRVEVRLVGMIPLAGEPDPHLVALLPASPVIAEVPPLETQTFVLAFQIQGADPPAAGSYEGLLVAAGGGDVVRRKVVLQVAGAPSAPAEDLGESVLLPAQMGALTLRGVNLLPSLISPLPPALLFIGLALLALRLFVHLLGLGWASGVRNWLLVGGVALLAAGVVLSLLVQTDVLPPIEPRSVQVKTVPLPEIAGLEQVGQVVAGDGGVGLLVHAEDRLEVLRIPRAGAYTGKMDLLPDQEELGEATVTVNVSDWWPYAFITLVLGVLLGAYLSRYYKEGRDRDRQDARAAELWREVCQAESDFQRTNAGRLQARFTIGQLARDWIDAAREDLARSDIDGGKASLDKLETFIAEFRVLCDKLERLDALYDETRRQFNRRTLNLGSEDIDAFRAAESALGGEQVLPFYFVTEKEAEERIAACETWVDQVTDWLRALKEALQSIDRYLDYAEGIDVFGPGWTKERIDQLRKQRRLLEDHGRAVLTAGKKEKVAEAAALADNAYVEILKLEKEAESAADVRLEGAELLMLARTRAFASLAAGVFKAVAEKETAVTPQVANLECRIESPEGFDEGNVDDLFVFGTSVTFPTLLTQGYEYEAQWDFGDGSVSRPFLLRPGEVAVGHRFNQGGSYTVALRDSAGQALATCEVAVRPERSRSEALRQAFRLDERRMTLISGLLTVGSGLLLLYFGDEAWGTVADYLKTFLWGSVISESAKEGARIVNNLMGRKWPLTA